MKSLRNLSSIALVLLLCAACSGTRENLLAERVAPLAYRFELAMTSQIPEPYYVLAGGSESYGRFPFNAWTRQALTELLAARSGGPDRPLITVQVELLELTTAYDEIGEGPSPTAPIYNGLGGGLLLGGLERGDGRAIPSEIHKSAELRSRLVLEGPGGRALARDLRQQVEIVVYWEEFDPWSYRYGEVLKRVIEQLRADIDAILVRQFAAGSGAG